MGDQKVYLNFIFNCIKSFNQTDVFNGIMIKALIMQILWNMRSIILLMKVKYFLVMSWKRIQKISKLNIIIQEFLKNRLNYLKKNYWWLYSNKFKRMCRWNIQFQTKCMLMSLNKLKEIYLRMWLTSFKKNLN